MLNDLRYRLRSLFERHDMEQELDEELAFHLEQQTFKYQEKGIEAGEARRLARLDLQGAEQTRERCRDARGIAWWDTTWQDLRYALRQLSRNPGFAITATLILSLGIGVNTAIFSLLDAVLLRSLPVRTPGDLIVPRWSANDTPHPFNSGEFEPCFASKAHRSEGGCAFSFSMFERIEAAHDVFSNAAAFAGPIQLHLGGYGEASIAHGELVSGSFFKTMGVGAAIGRTLTSIDDASKAPNVAVVSYAAWQNLFGGDPGIVGRTIHLSDVPFTVIGVAAEQFTHLSPGLTGSDFFIPLHAAPHLGIPWFPSPIGDGHVAIFKVVGRKQAGVSNEQAAAALTLIFRDGMIHESKLLKAGSQPLVEVEGAQQAFIGMRELLEKPLYILISAVGIILLIACANLASLVAARAAARQKEMAVRLAVGAGRARIFRQLVTESLLLAMAGGLCGIVVAFGAVHAITPLLSMDLHVTPDLRILLFTSCIALLSGLLFGALPALRVTRVDPLSVFSGGPGLRHLMSAMTRNFGFGKTMLAAQVALATVLLVGAGLMMRTLSNLRHADTGFDTRNLVLFGLDPIANHYSEKQAQALYHTLSERLAAMPGVQSVSYSSNALLSGNWGAEDYRVEGGSLTQSDHALTLQVGQNFFGTFGIPLLAGRTFSAAEFNANREVALVNRAFARRYLGGRNPLGQHFDGKGSHDLKTEIIGVVGDAKYARVRDDAKPTVYLPLRTGAVHFAVRTKGDPHRLIPVLRQVMHYLDRNLPLFEVTTQGEQIDKTLFIERTIMTLTSSFGILALLLTCVGLYGVFSYAVTSRTREIGIRLAIGAQPRTVRRGILRETASVIAVGLATGLPVALLAMRSLSALLYGVQASDPLVFAFSTLVLTLVALAAAYLPSRRASRVDPMTALRYE